MFCKLKHLCLCAIQESTTWTMLRIMFSEPANPSLSTNHNLNKSGNLPLVNRYWYYPVILDFWIPYTVHGCLVVSFPCILHCSFSMKEMSAALNERNKENRQDNIHSLETNLNNNDGETASASWWETNKREMPHVCWFFLPSYNQLDCVTVQTSCLLSKLLCFPKKLCFCLQDFVIPRETLLWLAKPLPFLRNFAFVCTTLAFPWETLFFLVKPLPFTNILCVHLH